jgi:hypothetical protein
MKTILSILTLLIVGCHQASIDNLTSLEIQNVQSIIVTEKTYNPYDSSVSTNILFQRELRDDPQFLKLLFTHVKESKSDPFVKLGGNTTNLNITIRFNDSVKQESSIDIHGKYFRTHNMDILKTEGFHEFSDPNAKRALLDYLKN